MASLNATLLRQIDCLKLRPSYQDAIRWIVLNDDITWLDEEERICGVTASMVAHLYGVDEAVVIRDILSDAHRAARGK